MFYLNLISISLLFNLVDLKLTDLTNLNLKDFNLFLEQHDYTLILFYLSNSTECEEAIEFTRNASVDLEKQFKRRRLYRKYDEFVSFITINCDHTRNRANKLKSNELCNAYSFNELPEWLLFRFGKQYKRLIEPDSYEKTLNWIRNNIRTPSIRFNSFIRLIAFVNQAKQPIVIGLFSNINDRLAIDNWLNSIEKLKLKWSYKDAFHVSFAHIFIDYANGSLSKLEQYIKANQQANKQVNLSLPSLIIARQKHMISKREKRFIIYRFFEDKEDIYEWIKRKIFGLILWRTKENEEELKFPLIIAYYNFDFEMNYENSYKWRNLIFDSAFKNSDLNFALSNTKYFGSYLKNNDLAVEDYEPLFIANDLFGCGYKFDDIYSEYEFNEFLNEYRAGQVKPIVKKSSKVSEHQDDSQIIELSALTFPKYVTFSRKDVFILFYANWCSHCKDSIKAMKELHLKIEKQDDLVLAQMECASNDAPSKLDIDHYPTFYLFKAKDQKLIKFESQKNVKALLQFVAFNSTKELAAIDRRGNLRSPKELNTFKNNLNQIKSNVLNKLDADLNNQREHIKNEL